MSKSRFSGGTRGNGRWDEEEHPRGKGGRFASGGGGVRMTTGYADAKRQIDAGKSVKWERFGDTWKVERGDRPSGWQDEDSMKNPWKVTLLDKNGKATTTTRYIDNKTFRKIAKRGLSY